MGWREEWKYRNSSQGLPNAAVCCVMWIKCVLIGTWCDFQEYSLPYPLQGTDDWIKRFSYGWIPWLRVFFCKICLYSIIYFLYMIYFQQHFMQTTFGIFDLIFVKGNMNKDLNFCIMSEYFFKYLTCNLSHKVAIEYLQRSHYICNRYAQSRNNSFFVFCQHKSWQDVYRLNKNLQLATRQ